MDKNFIVNLGTTETGVTYYDTVTDSYIKFKDENDDVINPEIVIKGRFITPAPDQEGTQYSTVVIDLSEIGKQLGENVQINTQTAAIDNIVQIDFYIE